MSLEQTWKVGALAEASGLTVRTLHHWDQIGLFSPSRRTPSGHREYTEEDVVRLYQVLALRRLGLGLESIAVCLDVGIDPTRLVGEHLSSVEASIAALETLRRQLAHIHGRLLSEDAPEVSTLIGVLQSMGGVDPDGSHVVLHRLDDDQVRALHDHASALGPAARYLLEVEWPELYRRADALRTSGVAPAAPQVQKLVKRMDELSSLFSGGDAGLSSAVRAAWKEELAAKSSAAGDTATTATATGDWRDLADFLERARSGA